LAKASLTAGEAGRVKCKLENGWTNHTSLRIDCRAPDLRQLLIHLTVSSMSR